MPNTPMIRTSQDPTDQEAWPHRAGSVPAAREVLATALVEGGNASQSGQVAGTDPDLEWLLERFLAMRVAELQHLPVQPEGGAAALGFDDATKALAALLELDLSTLLKLVPAEPFTFEERVDFGSSDRVETVVNDPSSPKPVGVVDDGTTPLDSPQSDNFPTDPISRTWFHPQSVTVAATNTNFGLGVVSDGNGSANSVAENAANGTVVGLIGQASDPDGDPVTYSLSNNASGRFAIDPNTGVVTVANASLLDFEANASHSITVVATSAAGTRMQSFTISVANANEGPGALNDTNAAANAVAENATDGIAVGLTARASDPEGDTVTYSLSNDAGGRFAIGSSTGVVTVANAALLDFETSASYSITVVATSSGGTSSRDYTIAVTDVAEPLVAVDDSANTDEDAAVSGNVLSNDTGGVGPLTVSLASGPASGTLNLNADGSFTYTPDVTFNGSDSFTYTVTDSLGTLDTGVVTITVDPLGADIFGTNSANTINGTPAKENIYGLNGSDDIFAGGGNDYVDGGIGSDDIYGEDGDDWLVGGNGTDQLFGGNGNDILDGANGGNSSVFGEAGDDTLIWSPALTTADGGAGTDTLRANSGSVNLTGASVGVASIEAIDLSRGSGASTVILSAQDILDISETDVLTILGADADSVEAGTGWTDGGVAGGVHTYTKNVGGTLATLVVDVDVVVNPDILT